MQKSVTSIKMHIVNDFKSLQRKLILSQIPEFYWFSLLKLGSITINVRLSDSSDKITLYISTTSQQRNHAML